MFYPDAPSLPFVAYIIITKEIAWNLGGTVAKCEQREYGFARVQINKFGADNSSADALFEGLGDELEVRVFFTRAARSCSS